MKPETGDARTQAWLPDRSSHACWRTSGFGRLKLPEGIWPGRVQAVPGHGQMKIAARYQVWRRTLDRQFEAG
jgi:hypothetical protein